MSKLSLRLFCPDCRKSVLMDKEVLIKQLMNWKEDPDYPFEQILTFRCDPCMMKALAENVPLQVN